MKHRSSNSQSLSSDITPISSDKNNILVYSIFLGHGKERVCPRAQKQNKGEKYKLLSSAGHSSWKSFAQCNAKMYM